MYPGADAHADARQQVQHPGFNVSACPSVLSFDRSVSVHLSFVCFAAGLILLKFFVFFFYQKRTEHGRRISVLRRQNLFWVFIHLFFFFPPAAAASDAMLNLWLRRRWGL